jgi:CO/xanthine dehydrogenase Mo-binding subunit
MKMMSGGGRGPSQGFLSNLADQEGAEVGVIVVAENADICEEALHALGVEWEELPVVIDLRKGRAPDAPAIGPTPRLAKPMDPEMTSEEESAVPIPRKRECLLFQHQ